MHPARRPLTDAIRSERLFAGEVVVFRQLEQTFDLVQHANSVIRDCFGVNPREAQGRMSAGEFAKRCKALRARFRTNSQTDRKFSAMLLGAGVRLDECYWDRRHLRIQPPEDPEISHAWDNWSHISLPAHRDTWGSNILCQTNWWVPLHTLDLRSGGLQWWPELFDTPVGNTSKGWDMRKLKEQQQRQWVQAAQEERRAARNDDASIHPTRAYHIMPEVLDIPSLGDTSSILSDSKPLQALIEPGDVLCFSGAHLHSSSINSSDRTRFSLEVRTVHLRDWQAGRGAPNVDGQSPSPPASTWFRLATDRGRLLPTAK
jgi:hypothetical protein